MLKHRKRISIFTLAIFMLTLVFSGVAPVMAKTAPGSPPVAGDQSAAPSSSNDRPNGVSPEGDAVKNSIGQGPNTNALGGKPILQSVSVSPGQLTGFNSYTNGPYQITVPGSVTAIRFITDPNIHTDKTKISVNGTEVHSYNGYGNTDDTLTLSPPGQDTEITYQLKNEGGFMQGPDEYRTYTFIVHRMPLVQSVLVTPERLIMWAQGATHPLTATVDPTAALQEVTWAVPSGAPVAVNPTSALTALVNPISAGITTVTAAAKDDPTKIDTSDVCVLPVGASLDLPATLEMNLDTPSAYDLTAKVMLGANEQTYVDASLFQWTAGPEGVVTVENNKKSVKITPIKVGTTTVTVKIPVDNGEDLVATCQVTVGQIILKVGAPQLKPDGTYTAWFGYENKFPYDVTLNLSTFPGGTGGHIIAGVRPNQLSANVNLLEVFKMGYGQSESPPAWTITYKNWTQTVTAGKDQRAYVEVTPPEVELVMGMGMTAELTATTLNGPVPLGPILSQGSPQITWESADLSIATITSQSPDGRTCIVTPVGPGVVRVYARFNGTEDYSTVTVLQPVEGVAIERDEEELLQDDAVLLMSQEPHYFKALLQPSNANFPKPENTIYEWITVGDTNSVSLIDPVSFDDEYGLRPKADQPGTVEVTLNVKDKTTQKVFATAGFTVHVGKIDIQLQGEPDFYQNGRYEASFGYESTFPIDVEIPIYGGAQPAADSIANCWGNLNVLLGSGDIIRGTQPTVFKPGKHPNQFRIKYWEHSQVWIVKFEGRLDAEVAKTFQSIRWVDKDDYCKVIGLKDSFTLTADPSYSKSGDGGGTSTLAQFQPEIVWDIPWQSSPGVVAIDGKTNQFTCNVEAQKPGMAIVRVSIVDNNQRDNELFGQQNCRKQALCFVNVRDNRTLTLDKEELTIRRGRTADLNALIDYEELYNDRTGFAHWGLPKDWNNVQWGFVLKPDEGRPYIVDSLEFASLTPSGTNNIIGTLQGLKKGTVTAIAYLDNNCYSKRVWQRAGVPQEFIGELETMCWDRKFYLDKLPEGRFDICEVTIRNPNRPEEEEPKKKSSSPAPTTPAPPALETLDVTITVGNNLALVNEQQVTLSGNTLLIGKDRAMVDYGDISKLLPGVVVTWDWQTQTVTFTKGEQVVSMKLDEIPAGFDVPFMNIGGRLVVPVRYVGSFFGATVDWVGNTLVVHMYK